MAEAIDPVCGMTVDTSHAPAESHVGGGTYYFCSIQCRDRFDADPDRYLGQRSRGREDSGSEDSGSGRSGDRLSENIGNEKFTTPRWGSAGSGGAEFEPVPEMDERKID